MGFISFEHLSNRTYINFISEAVKRSDMISFDLYWPDEVMPLTHPDFGEEYFLSQGFTKEFFDQIWEQRKKEHNITKQRFKTECLPFVHRLQPYFVHEQMLEVGSSRYFLNVDSGLTELLLEPKSIGAWISPCYPENLGFISRKSYWFCSETHESCALLCPNDESDYKFWQNMGVVFLDDFNPEIDVVNRSVIDI